jgi:hypothetical protein
MTARWIPVDLLLAVAEQREEAAWSRYRHGHRVAAFTAREAERRATPAEPCSWEASEPPRRPGPWPGLRDRELAEEAARLVRLNGLRPTCRRLGIDHQTLRRAWRHHGIEAPSLQHERRR